MNFFFQICSATSAGNASCNEDLADSQGREIWIFDGATSISKRSTILEGRFFTDAAWFVNTVSRQLKLTVGMDLKQRLSAATDVARNQALKLWGEFEDGAAPSASFAYAVVKGDFAFLQNLGDCKIIYSADDGMPAAFGSCNVSTLDAQLLELHLRNKAQYPNLSKEQQWRILHPKIQGNREKMNTAEGYWILSPDAKGIDYIEGLKVPFRKEIKIALVSDGLYRLVDTYMVYRLEEFFLKCCSKEGIGLLMRELRFLESSDMDCSKYPRVKLADDATVISISVTN